MTLTLPLRFLATVTMLTVLTTTALADTFGTGTSQFTIDFVEISGSTNPTPAQATAGDLDGFGIVEYDYRIGVYEITNDQWNRFEAELGVPVTGDPSQGYVRGFHDWGTGTTDVPANGVSWYEAAQFVNWLNTSTGHHAAYNFTGTQGLSDYSFARWDASEAWGGTNLYRHKEAFYFLPDEDEWCKAAYWSGTSIQDYATMPGDTLHQGDGSGGTGWNYWDWDHGYATYPKGPWDVGSGSEELNGTYDMMGNNCEWVESPWDDPNFDSASPRAWRGGNWLGSSICLLPSSRSWNGPSSESGIIGFRVASIPEPGGITLLLCGLAGVLPWWRRRK